MIQQLSHEFMKGPPRIYVIVDLAQNDYGIQRGMSRNPPQYSLLSQLPWFLLKAYRQVFTSWFTLFVNSSMTRGLALHAHVEDNMCRYPPENE